MEADQAVRKVIKAGGSMGLTHPPRTHRTHAAAIPEHFFRGAVDLQCERTQSEAADFGAKRFTDPLAW
eukprot:6142960-Pyramimonas_sp.AAC.1